MRFFAVVFNFVVAASFASPPVVPQKVHFAGMVLTLSEAARRDIQRDIDALHGNGQYFNVKVERAKTYFPIIEQIFENEGLPQDFKYLALQESSLIGDAVSTSNAVGFWQFKDYTAREVGLRVDDVVDERKSIVSSTIGAARYLKRSNQKLNNWIYSLQSYQMGLGGVMRATGGQGKGLAHMDISNDTYWYIKKFIAVKTAFEEAMVGEPLFKVGLQIVQSKKLSDLINETGHNEKVLRDLNKWIIRDIIPGDKSYFVVIPLKNIDATEPQLYAVLESTSSMYKVDSTAKSKTTAGTKTPKTRRPRDTRLINGAVAAYVYENESLHDFAKRMDISKAYIRHCNDLDKDSPWRNATYYFTEKKKKIGEKDATYVLQGEDWWKVSQRTGIKLKKLLSYNRKVILGEGKKVRLKPKPLFAFLNRKKEEILIGNVDWDKSSQVVKVRESSSPEPVSVLKEKTVPETIPEVVAVKEENPSFQPVPSTQISAPEVKTPEILAPSKNVEEHIVQSGETLYRIARKYNVTVDSVISWNKLTSGTIHEGDRLVIPMVEQRPLIEKADDSAGVAANSTVPGVLIHEVASGETLFSIARTYSVSVKELMESNKKTNFSVAIGEKLKINGK